MIKTHLDKIVELGFYVDISWNTSFSIDFIDLDILVLRAVYETQHEFEDFMEVCIDMFYCWYNENYKIIQKIELSQGNEKDELIEKIEKNLLGHITTRVNRELSLNKLI